MGREFELKFRLTRQQYTAIRAAFPTLAPIDMETTYYDTPDGALRRRKWMLRRRLENKTAICTLKTPLPDGSRGEWECIADTINAGCARLILLDAPIVLADLASVGLQAVCGARFTRFAAEVPTADGIAELALDSGILFSGSREIPLCEVEIELKTGSDTAAQALADQIAAEFGLTEEPRSKFQRASALTKGE